MSEWIVIAIDYFIVPLSTFAGNEVFAIPRRSPFPNFPLLINHFLSILYLYRQMSCWEKEEERIKIIVMMYNLL